MEAELGVFVGDVVRAELVTGGKKIKGYLKNSL